MAWLETHEKKPTDEYFWHATSKTNVRKIYESGEIKPEYGSGGNGPGFYVAPFVTDYIKVMAYRNLKPEDMGWMFLLKILARDFYSMTGYFSDDGLAGTVGHEVGDFVAARWSVEISGDTGYKNPSGVMVRYDQHQGKPLDTIGLRDGKKDFEQGKNWREKAASRKDALDTLWICAQKNKIDTKNEELTRLMEMHGPRPAFLKTIEEVTFKKSAGPKLHVVGGRYYDVNKVPNDGLYANEREIALSHLKDVVDLD